MIVKKVIENNPQPVADYNSGNKKKAIGFFDGSVHERVKGKRRPWSGK